MNLKDTKVYSINDFVDWYERGELDLTPKYQRNNVWNSSAESYLIDTIIRGLPIPQVFIRLSIDTTLRKSHREVIDGQQRLRTIIKFIHNKISINKLHNKEYGGFHYEDLPDEVKNDFLSFKIPVEIITSADDNVIFDLFVRVNTNSYSLTKQELRNAKYWGDFKVLTYSIARNYRDLFGEVRTFNIKDFLRMNDAEFISSLLSLHLIGVQNETPSQLDKVYATFEMIEDERIEKIEETFSYFLKLLEKILRNDLNVFEYFNKKNYIYTLFACFLLSLGINPISTQIKVKVNRLDYESLVDKLLIIEGEISKILREDFTESDYYKFYNLHNIRTTNYTERLERINLLIKFLNLPI